MAESAYPDRLPLPKSWPDLVKRTLVLVNSLLKVSFDIELGRRLDCASHHAREHAEHERLRLDSDSDREVLRLISARLGRLDPKKRPHYTMPSQTAAPARVSGCFTKKHAVRRPSIPGRDPHALD